MHSESKASRIRSILAINGWQRTHLAKKAGLSYRVLNNVICGNNTGAKSRRAIEAALDISLWPDSPTSSSKPRPLETSGTTNNPPE